MKIRWDMPGPAQQHPVVGDLVQGKAYNVPDALGVHWCLQAVPGHEGVTAASPIDPAGRALVSAEVSRRDAARRAAQDQEQQQAAEPVQPAREFGPIDVDEPARAGAEE